LKFTLPQSHENESAFGVIPDNCLSLAFRKCKKDANIILKVFLVQGFCPLKTEIAGVKENERNNVSYM